MSKNNFRAFIAFIIALIIIIAVVFSCGIGSSVNGKWFKNKDVQTWFDSWGKGSSSEDNDSEDEKKDNEGENGDSSVTGSGATVSEVTEEKGIALTSVAIPVELYSEYDISPAVESAYKITAKFEPENYDEQDVIWSIDWANEPSIWADSSANVSDYVEIESGRIQRSTTDSEPSVTIKVLQPFGTQIVLTVQSKYYRSVSATATFDYIMRADVASIGSGIEGEISLHFVDDDSASAVYQINLAKSIGTVSGTYKITSATVQFKDDVRFEKNSSFVIAGGNFTQVCYNNGWNEMAGTFRFNNEPLPLNLNVTSELKGKISLDYKKFFTSSSVGPGCSQILLNYPEVSGYCKEYIRTVAEMSNISDWGTVTFYGTYSYGDFYSEEFSCKTVVKGWSIHFTPPTGLEVDNGSFYF